MEHSWMQQVIENLYNILTKKKYRLHFIVTITFCIFFLNIFHYFLQACQNHGIGGYTLAFHYLSYDFGFIPRTLYGSTCGRLAVLLPRSAYKLFWIFLACLPFLCFFILFIKRRKLSKNGESLDLMWMFLLALPTTWLPFVDVFRFDVILLFFFLIFGYATWTGTHLRLFVPIGMVIMTLIHDAAIFMYIPTLCGIMIYKGERRLSDYLFTVWYVIGALTSVILYWMIRNTPVDQQMIDETINKLCTFPITSKLSLSGHFDSINNGYLHHMFIGQLRNWCWILRILFSIPFIFVINLIFYHFWKKIYDAHSHSSIEWKRRFFLLQLSTLSNVCLFIGCDFNRWYSAFFTIHLFLMMMVLTDPNTSSLLLTKKKEKVCFLFLLLFLCLSGPGDCFGFSNAICSFANVLGDFLNNFVPISKG